MGFPKIQTGRYSYADYLTWGDEERCEVINGFVSDMTAAPYTNHQRISGNLFSIIHSYVRGKKVKAFAAPFDVRFPDSSLDDDKTLTVVQPDISVFLDPSKIDSRGGKLPPEWIIEILSPSTYKADKVLKLELYEKHGVLEYWIIDPEKEVISVYILNNEIKYVHVADYLRTEKINVKIFTDLVISAEEIFCD